MKYKKQAYMILLTMEAKYIACFAAVREDVWRKRFIEDLKININNDNLVIIYCDSQAVISFSKDAKYHSKSKHIKTTYNFIRDILAKNEVAI